MTRENTFRVDYSCFPVKPTYEKVHGFCRTVLGLKKEDLRRLQCNRGEQCAFVEVSNLTLAQKIVHEHDEKHEVEYGGKKIKLRITMEDGSVEVKVHDLPESVTKEKIVEFLCGFGEVLSIHELTWGEEYEYAGVPTGVWSARMLIKRNIDSWVTIDGQPALITYKGQLLSCRYCKEQTHSGISCVQNKKLLVQKSYANVAKQSAQRPPKKPTGVKTPSTKSSDRGPSAPTPVLSATAFPELPNPTNQSEQSVSTTKPNGQSEQIDLPVPSSERPKRGQDSSPSPHAAESSKTPAVLLDLFKKPATRSQSKINKNGNDTDDSITSNSSRRNRERPPGKKPRRDSSDDEKDAE